MQLLLAVTICFAAINVVTYVLYAHDKRRAEEGGWRVPERRLILLAALGGATGAFAAMRVCHHKTRKLKFAVVVPALMVAQVLALALFLALSLFAQGRYEADARAVAALESSATVTVDRKSWGYLFDGPGTDELLVFYPGGNVTSEAYAPLMQAISQEGVDCAVVNMPFCLAFLGVNRAEQVMAELPYESYIVGGHSLGGVAAGMFAAQHPDELAGLVLLASFVTDDLSATGLEVLSAYGTCDGVLDLERYEECRANLPETTEELVIEGANHGQFGSYGGQAGDGTATITAEEQWAETADAIAALW